MGFGVRCRVFARHRLSRPHCRGAGSGASFPGPFRQLLPTHLCLGSVGFGVGCRVSARHRLSRPHCRGAGPGTSFPGPFRQLLPAHLCLGSVGFGVGCRVSAQHRLSRPHCRGVSSGTSFSDPFRQLLPAHLSRFGGFRGALSCLCAASAFPAALPRCGFRCILFRPLPAALAGAPLPRSPQGRADAESKFANCPHGRPAGRLSGHFERSRPAGRCASGAVSDCRIAEVSAASPNRDRSCDTVLAMPSRTADCIRRAHALFAAGRRSLRAIRTKRPGCAGDGNLRAFSCVSRCPKPTNRSTVCVRERSATICEAAPP